MLNLDNLDDSAWEDLAWQIMIVSMFRQSERQTLNLIITLVGIKTEKEASQLLTQIFKLVRKGVIYVPEARLEIFRDSPERVDVYLLKDFDKTMKDLSNELKMKRKEFDYKKNVDRIPKKVLIDIKNYTEGKYIEKY